MIRNLISNLLRGGGGGGEGNFKSNQLTNANRNKGMLLQCEMFYQATEVKPNSCEITR